METQLWRIFHYVLTSFPPSLGPIDFQHHGELRYITRDSKMLINPSEEEMGSDSLDDAKRSGDDSNSWWPLIQPPEFLADHAPINYVAHLERLL